MVIAGQNISPPQIKKMKELHDQGVPMDQILSQIYTSAGETLADAINSYNNNLVYENPDNQYQSTITPSDIEHLISSGSTTSHPSFGLNGPVGLFALLVIIFFFWQSEPSGWSNNLSGRKTHLKTPTI